jgi:hypothetical protein
MASAAAASPPRTWTIGRRGYRVHGPSLRDPRLHVAAVLLTLQALGQTVLGFRLSVAQILVSIAAGALIEFLIALLKDRVILWPASGMLTGNSTAFILRIPGTVHGQWWSVRGIWIFVGVVAVSMASKYLIRWRGRHIFNPSNLGLVLAFAALGPKYTEPLDLWWGPLGPWMIAAYAILIVGGLVIAWEIRLLGLELSFLLGFAVFTALALAPIPDHCMVASWHAAPLCGADLWQVLVTSPEILLFGLFMIPDPRTVPDGLLARIAFGLFVALLAVLLLGPTTVEFWTKTAILGSLVVACATRFALGALVAPLEEREGLGEALGRAGWRLPVAVLAVLVLVEALPVSAALSTQGTEPAAGRTDGAPVASVTLKVGPATALSGWVTDTAVTALPAGGQPGAPAPSGYVWAVPSLPAISVESAVSSFDPSITPAVASQMAHDAVLDLVIESEARRVRDTRLAEQGASDDGLQEFVDVINQDLASGNRVDKAYSFDKVSLDLYLPKFSTQASRLVGVNLHGTTTITVTDASGHELSRTTSSYATSWGLGTLPVGGHRLIINDYTDLTPVP